MKQYIIEIICCIRHSGIPLEMQEYLIDMLKERMERYD